MAAKKVKALCQSGGKLERNEDGSFSYIFDLEQLEAHLIEVNNDTKVSTFKEDVSKLFRGSPDDAVSAKYFFPNQKYTPITISKDADLQSLVECYEKISVPVHVFITIKKPPPALAPAADPAVSTRPPSKDWVESVIREKLNKFLDMVMKDIIDEINRDHKIIVKTHDFCDYCPKWFTTDTYRLACAESNSIVQPVEIPGTNELTTQKMLVVTPPKKRPRNPERQRGLVVTPPKKRRHCSSCQGRGHDKRNCYFGEQSGERRVRARE